MNSFAVTGHVLNGLASVEWSVQNCRLEMWISLKIYVLLWETSEINLFKKVI